MILKRATLIRTFPLICCCLLLRIFLIRERQIIEEPQETKADLDQAEQLAALAGIYDDSSNLERVQEDQQESKTPADAEPSSVGSPLKVSTNSTLTDDNSQVSTTSQSFSHSASNALTLQREKHNSTDGKNILVGRHQNHVRVSKDFEEPVPLWTRTTDSLYVYSAFWDDRNDLTDGPLVRILGIMKYRKDAVEHIANVKWTGVVKDGALNCSCLLWYTGQQEPLAGLLKAFIFEEGMKEFVGTFFLCYPKLTNHTAVNNNLLNSNSSDDSKYNKDTHMPYAVSLVPEGSVISPHKLVYLSNSRRTPVSRNSSAVCVRPLFGPYSDLQSTTQFISYYAMVMDVSHFYFYDLAIDAKVKGLLNAFNNEHIVITILPWNTPTSNWDELWDLGSLTALNDCVYRTSGYHSHVAIVDLDEFIVPMLPAAGLGDVYLNVLKYKRGLQGDAALVSNAFFCPEFKENYHTNKQEFPIFQYTQREARLWPATTRSKMIVIPQTVISVGHHMVHHFLLKTLQNQASPKLVSVLHHYRTCVDLRLGIHGKGSLVLTQETLKDASMMKYKRLLLSSRFVAIYKNFTKEDT